MIELSLIKYLLDYNNYKDNITYITPDLFQGEYKFIYDVLTEHFKDSQNTLTVQDLANLAFAKQPKDKEFYTQFFNNLNSYIPVESTVVSLVKGIKRKKLLEAISLAAYEEAEGRKAPGSVEQLLESLETQQVEVQAEFVTDDLDTLLNECVSTPGLRWRQQSLNTSLGSLRKGDFGFIFARPETGKTTFLADQTAHFLTQVNSPILWFN